MTRALRPFGLMLAVGLALSACVTPPAGRNVTPPARPIAQTPPANAPDTPASAAARAYYGQVQQALLSQGLLRTDGGGPDTPFSADLLTRNFIKIALYDEYDRGGAPSSVGQLRRWNAPVRVGLRFGASVSAQRRATDTAMVGSYLARLSRLTGHAIALDDIAPNFYVYMVSEDERRALGPEIRAAMPELGPGDVRSVTDMPRSTYCIVLAQSAGSTGVYQHAFAVIRSEHPDLLRLSCVHEEIAQGLGLPNDSPLARPSIFNDDEEFALLTRQDEMMLRLLYNPALRPGMTEAEARPIVTDLAKGLVGGES
ncbi:DUF2927 domain-containing protein [Fuscibacter oryzae]|uniref:DUF2927 domain-containing protein n=1 Tax=Fuscibacter oryzae TaxID=2803939 RepID=A0A8J7MQ78_9RHOB|nr:DUF2927 domain-containing protein [Fuscibacter oryzae]MBL4926725.1 DUF2927 domain-containing protein [Fuscibacter oryzae]